MKTQLEAKQEIELAKAQKLLLEQGNLISALRKENDQLRHENASRNPVNLVNPVSLLGIGIATPL